MLVAAALCAGAAACGAGQAKAEPNTARFLTLAHQPLAGILSGATDAQLLDLGRRACAGLDSQQSSDVIVAQIGGNPLPGSAEFNAYSFIVIDAATSLCPSHKDQFSKLPPM